MSAPSSVAPSLDELVKQRLDDIGELLAVEGHSRRSRAELTRALIYACPVDDPDHLNLVIRYGAMRLFNEIDFPNDDWLEEAEADLAWYAESTDRSALVSELRRVKTELKWLRHHARDVLRGVDNLIGGKSVRDR